MHLGRMKFSKFLLLASVILILGILTTKVIAVSPSSILVNVSPESPTPGETVNITLSSYAASLDSVSINWSVNGKSSLSGIGKKSFSLVAPSAGSETRIIATVSLPDGSIDKNITIRPTVMALLWEATDSYVPPFYKGKALPSSGSELKVVAMPEIKSGSLLVNPKNLVYAWKKDYTNDPNASGYSKNYYLFINDYLEDSTNVSVVASTTDQKYTSQASMNIRTFEPKIVFYKNDLSLGTLWEQALYNDYSIASDIIVEAAPYFISPGDIRIPSLEWGWSINDLYIAANPVQKNVMPLKAQPGTSGKSKIRLELKNKYKIFERAEGQINLTF